MNIGIDIDNVISNFNEVLLEEYLIHDKEIGKRGIINKNAEYIRRGMFDWSEIEEKTFYKQNIERIVKKLNNYLLVSDDRIIIKVNFLCL